MRMLSCLAASLLALSLGLPAAHAQVTQGDFPALFAKEVTRKVALDANDVALYQGLLIEALDGLKVDARPEFYVMVDRNPAVQRLSLFVGTPAELTFVGAAPVATGNIGRFDYYITPLGVFEHKLMSDFRAEGSRNEHGIKGYGSRGMRIWDFGWYPATKGWKTASAEPTNIRFQMHATDPGLLEPKLGRPGSKGCVRVPESLNKFMDRYGVLDFSYDQAAAVSGKAPWIWNAQHERTPFSGRYIVVVDTSETAFGR